MEPDAPAHDDLSPGTGAPTAAPSVGARIAGVSAIVAAGAAGGFIGWSYVDLQCEGDCSLATAGGGFVGAVVGALGVAIVVVLALRAMAEWQTVQQRQGPIAPTPPPDAQPRRRRPSDGGGDRPPRVS